MLLILEGRLRLAALASPIAAALLAVPAAAAAAPTPQQIEAVREMIGAHERDDCPTVLRLGLPLVDSKVPIHDDVAIDAFDLVVRCEASAEDFAAAHRHALAGTRLEESSDFLWRMRLAIELQTDNLDAATTTVEAMDQGGARR